MQAISHQGCHHSRTWAQNFAVHVFMLILVSLLVRTAWLRGWVRSGLRPWAHGEQSTLGL